MEARQITGSTEIVLDNPRPKKPRPLSKKLHDQSRAKTRVNLGFAFERWRQLRAQKDFKTDAELANVLLNSYEHYAQGASISTPVKHCDQRASAPSISSIGAKSESRKLEKRPDDAIHVEKRGDLQCDQEIQANSPMAGDPHLTGVSEITTTTNMSYEEGCTGITFDISEITFATDEDSDCSNQETGEGGEEEKEEEEEEEEDNEETESAEELDDSDPEWAKDALSGSELSDSGHLEKDQWNEVHRKARELCPDCGNFFYVGKTHTCEYKIKPFPCNICGKRCKNKGCLKRHSRIHEEDYQHLCKFCWAPFRTRLDKLAHQRAHIYTEKPYKCPDCVKTFSKLRVRNSHLKEHRGSSNVSCPHCALVFTRAYVMRRHIVVHTGVKQFVCKFCSRSFNQPGHLKSHLRLHTGEKPYQCQHCDKSFNHNVSLKSHVMRYHKEASESGPREHTKEKMEPPPARIEEMNEEISNGDTKGTGEVVIEQHPKLQEEPIKRIKKMRERSMGRPIGRPKRNAAMGETNSIPAVRGKALDQITAAEPAEEGHLKRASSKSIESDWSDSDPTSELAGDDEAKESKGVRKSRRKTSQRPKTFETAEEDFDSDSDFDPAEYEAKKRRTSLQKSGSLGARRGRAGNN